MGLKHYDRHSAAVIRSKRWKGVRLEVKRRDGWKCVQCGARGRLEVDHIQPVRTHPELSYDLSNLQTLCGSCHGRKTRLELGFDPMHPERERWRKLTRDLEKRTKKQ